MRTTMIALVAALAFPARPQSGEWAPEKELVFTGRKLEIYQHGVPSRKA